MYKHQCNAAHNSAQHLYLECPSCKQLFESDAGALNAGQAILCPYCHNSFVCSTKELFTALKHINKMVG